MNKALALLALVFLIGAIGLGIVALATNNWEEKDESTFGFFQSCRKDDKVVFCTNNLDDYHKDAFKDDEWYLVSVGSHCGGVLFGFIAMVLWFSALCTKNTGIRGGAIICAILTFAGFLCCVIVFKFKYVEDNKDGRFKDFSEGFSFWLGVGASAAAGIAVILMIVAAVSHRKK